MLPRVLRPDSSQITGSSHGPFLVSARLYMVITSSKSKDQPSKTVNPARGQLNRKKIKKYVVAVSPTGGVFPYLPHHLDLASEDSVGHSTCMSVLTLTTTLTLTETALSRYCYGRWCTAKSPTHSPATRLHVL